MYIGQSKGKLEGVSQCFDCGKVTHVYVSDIFNIHKEWDEL